MSAGIYNFTIEQGADYASTITWYTDAAGTVAKNLTGYTARMSIKTNDLATTVLSTAGGTISLALGGSAGTIAITITSATTTALPATLKNKLVYDLELVSGGSVVTRLLQGHVTVSPEVTT